MNLYDISSVKIDLDQNGLYDLTEPTFSLKDLPRYPFTVMKEHEMRIDLISKEIYKSIDYSDMILNLNDIDNPLNIKSGDIIYYVDLGEIEGYKLDNNASKENRKNLLSQNKSNVKDNNRQKYIEDNYQLPPTILSLPQSPITSNGNKITITPID